MQRYIYYVLYIIYSYCLKSMYLGYITLAVARTLPKVSWVLLGISPPLKLALGLQLDYIDEQFKHL